MTISDGTTTFTVSETLCIENRELIKGTVTSAGGLLKSQISGIRFVMTERFYVSGDDFEILFDLLTNGSDNYYYTPSFTLPGISDDNFPMDVSIDLENVDPIGAETLRYDITLIIRGADYV